MNIWLWLLIGIILGLLYFYRYPFWNNWPILSNNNQKVYSPAYGHIMDINRLKNGNFFIAIFLSPWDIHYQFSPVMGIISKIEYDDTGKFELAYNLNKSKDNEKVIYTIETNRGTFKIFQIAGHLVRRISLFRKTGQSIKTGDLLGLIHFGSRVDIIIPNPMNNFKLVVKNGQKISATTALGYYNI